MRYAINSFTRGIAWPRRGASARSSLPIRSRWAALPPDRAATSRTHTCAPVTRALARSDTTTGRSSAAAREPATARHRARGTAHGFARVGERIPCYLIGVADPPGSAGPPHYVLEVTMGHSQVVIEANCAY